MWAAITNFFNYFIGIVESIVSFVSSLIQGLIQMMLNIPAAISMLTSSVGYLPSTLAVFATLTITISVIYLIVGRETGG